MSNRKENNKKLYFSIHAYCFTNKHISLNEWKKHAHKILRYNVFWSTRSANLCETIDVINLGTVQMKEILQSTEFQPLDIDRVKRGKIKQSYTHLSIKKRGGRKKDLLEVQWNVYKISKFTRHNPVNSI